MAAGSCCHTSGCLSLLAKSCRGTGRSVLALATAVLCLQPAREALLLSIAVKLKAIPFNRMLSGPIKAAKSTPGISSTRFNATSAATSAGQFAANESALGAALTKSSARVRNQINARAQSQSQTQASINVAIELKLQQLPYRAVPCRTLPQALLPFWRTNPISFNLLAIIQRIHFDCGPKEKPFCWLTNLINRRPGCRKKRLKKTQK